MIKRILFAIFLIICVLLITSCRPEIGPGRAIETPEQKYDLANFPYTQFHDFDYELDPVPVKIYTTAEFQTAADTLVEEIGKKICTEGDQYINGDCTYNFEPDYIDTIGTTPRFIAIGSCDDAEIRRLLDPTVCDGLVQDKAVIQYINQGQLVIAGGSDKDIAEAVYTLTDHLKDLIYLNGYYSDIINTEKTLSISHKTPTDAIAYTQKYYFSPGKNKISNPLSLPENKQSITNFFGTNLNKVNKIYEYDPAAQAYTKIYSPETPSNLDAFAERGKIYIVDAEEPFEVTILNAALQTANLAGAQDLPEETEKILSAFVTGAAVNSITGGATAGYAYVCGDAYCLDSETSGISLNSKDYSTKGTVSGSNQYEPSFSYTDECIDSSTLKEWYCNQACSAASEEHTCPTGYTCSDGACIEEAAEGTQLPEEEQEIINLYGCRRDIGQGAYDHYTEANICEHLTQRILGRAYASEQEGTTKLIQCEASSPPKDLFLTLDNCKPGTTFDRSLGWIYKEKPATPETVPLILCSFEKGERYALGGTTQCNPDSTKEATWYVLPFCTETDNGKNIGIKGTTNSYVEGKSYTDYCEGSTLIEYSCDATALPNGIKQEQVTCKAGYTCSDGACRPVYDFSLAKGTEDYDEVNQEVTFKIIADNAGAPVSEELGPITITDTLPAGTTYNSAVPEPSTVSGNILTWTISKMDNDESTDYDYEPDTRRYQSKGMFIIEIVAGVDAAPGTEITNTARLTVQDIQKEASDSFEAKTIPEVELTRPVYRCWHQYQWDEFPTTEDHYLSFNEGCGEDYSDGLLGHVYIEEQPNTQALYQCYRENEHTEYVNLQKRDHIYRDHFASTDENCEGFRSESLIGYIPTTETDNTKKIYRCWDYPDSISDGRYDHMLSTEAACEGYNNEDITYYFLKEPVTEVPRVVAAAPGETCTQTSDCQSGYECISNICTRKVPIYACDWEFLDTSSSCTDFFTGDPASRSVQIGYFLDSSVPDVPDTALLGTCQNQATGSYSFALKTGTTVPCQPGYGFEPLGYIYKTQRTETIPLSLCADYNQNYNLLSYSNDTCPTDYPIETPSTDMFFFPEPGCGNGRIEPPETCDDGNLQNGDGCDSNCQIEAPTPYCGDGNVDAGEECDPPDGITCDANCQNITLPPGVPPLVPPPTIPSLPPLPHQFYGIVGNAAQGMSIKALNQGNTFNTTVDPQMQYGYLPLFFVTGTQNGTIISWYVNNSFDQNFSSFQQGAITRLDLTYQPAGPPPPTGPSCFDNIQNQDETDVDCGGTTCPACPVGDECNRNSDCRTNYCRNGVCKRRPVTAGGGGGGGGLGRLYTPGEEFYGVSPTPTGEAECFDDWICDPWGPCINGTQTRECFLNDYPECTIQLEKPETTRECEMPPAPTPEPSCFDGIQNQDETFPDCGGRCKPCDPGLPCIRDSDCVTDYCNSATGLCDWPPAPVEEIPKARSNWWIWLIVILAAIGIGGGIIAAIMLKKKPLPNHRLEDLREYVSKYREKGVSEERIRRRVTKAGWKKEDIDKVLK